MTTKLTLANPICFESVWWTCIAMAYCNFVSAIMRLDVDIADKLFCGFHLENVNNTVYNLFKYVSTVRR